MNAIVADDGPECPRCDAVEWDEDGTLTCTACGYTPRASVRASIRGVLNR